MSGHDTPGRPPHDGAPADDPALASARDGGDGDPFAADRQRMIEVQLRARGVRDARVLAAMAAVPREAFVPHHLRHLAYADEALPAEEGQTISQPLMVGLMTQLLDPDPGDRVLDIGTGTGYQAAVLAAMGCAVTSIERIEVLARTAEARLAALGYGASVEVRVGDGGAGAADGAPWPRILVAAAVPAVPPRLVEQLADGGRLVLPVGPRWEQELVLVERHGTTTRRSNHGGCVFVPLIGEGGYR